MFTGGKEREHWHGMNQCNCTAQKIKKFLIENFFFCAVLVLRIFKQFCANVHLYFKCFAVSYKFLQDTGKNLYKEEQ